MNFSRNGTKNKYRQAVQTKKKNKTKAFVLSFRMLILCIVFAICIGGFAAAGIIKGILDNAPDISSITVAPTEFATTIYDSDGNEIQKLIGSDANRIYVNIDTIPEDVINAFVAIEDERFWEHNGVDVKGILRAVFSGLAGGFDQGASTITQQLLKNTVFNGGMETNFSDKMERKIQEQYLAVQLEHRISKKEILEYYLNTINLGQNTLGVEAASQRYFNKNISDLTLSEAAVIAGITKNPSAYNPISNPEKNAQRRNTILSKMKQQGYISEEEYTDAMADDVYAEIQLVNEEQYSSGSNVNSYFVDALVEQVANDLSEELGYNSTQAYNLIYRGGLRIYTTQDTSLQNICDEVLADDSLYPANSKFELTYRLSFTDKDGEIHNYSELNLKSYFQKKDSNFSLYFNKKEDAEPYIQEYRSSVIKDTDTIDGETTSFTLQPQVSFVLMDQYTGQIKALVGGRGEKMASRTLNRATDTTRQPGSTFKIVSTYLPALDTKGMTLATVFDDDRYFYPGTSTQVNNWNGENYNGFTTIREAIYNSMNIMAVKTLEQVTPQTGFSYLQKLGFSTLVDNRTDEATGKVYSDINLSLALGGITDGVTNLELTNSFASIANGGNYNQPSYYTKIVDHNGKVLLENKNASTQVMKDSTAWLLTNTMEDVVKVGTGKKVQFQNVSMPIAGKTGTTSNENDLWFVGYTPYYTAGIWGGYDSNSSQSDTTYPKVLWRTIMEKIHMNLERKEFTKPDSIVSAKICTKSGKLAVDGVCDQAPGASTVRTEYFAKGTQPTDSCDVHVKVKICTASGKSPGIHCPFGSIISKVFLIKADETAATKDTPYILPKDFESNTCKVHGTKNPPLDTTDPYESLKDKTEPEIGEGEAGGENNGAPNALPDTEQETPEEDGEADVTKPY